jgi:simple sugar transport system ATP-binding protein
VLQVADEVQVMRLGRRVATFKAQGTTMEELVGAMTGAVTQDDGTQEAGLLENGAQEKQS